MKLSLSARIAESFYDKKIATVPFEDLAQLGKGQRLMVQSACGRPLPVYSRQMIASRRCGKHFDRLGLKVSMVTGGLCYPREF